MSTPNLFITENEHRDQFLRLLNNIYKIDDSYGNNVMLPIIKKKYNRIDVKKEYNRIDVYVETSFHVIAFEMKRDITKESLRKGVTQTLENLDTLYTLDGINKYKCINSYLLIPEPTTKLERELANKYNRILDRSAKNCHLLVDFKEVIYDSEQDSDSLKSSDFYEWFNHLLCMRTYNNITHHKHDKSQLRQEYKDFIHTFDKKIKSIESTIEKYIANPILTTKELSREQMMYNLIVDRSDNKKLCKPLRLNPSAWNINVASQSITNLVKKNIIEIIRKEKFTDDMKYAYRSADYLIRVLRIYY